MPYTHQLPSSASHAPGTVHLVDLERTLQVKHATGQNRDVVLVPVPTDEPDDPLNWAQWRKQLALICMVFYVIAVGVSSAAIYSVLENISANSHLTLDDLNQGTGYMVRTLLYRDVEIVLQNTGVADLQLQFLLFGWGCLLWQPLALYYGKRPVYLASLAGTMATMIWAPYKKTRVQWITSKILQGFFGAPIESLCQVTVADLYFTHERGWYLAVYGLSLSGSSMSAPILAGFIADGQGWEWVLYWCAILCAVVFSALFFMMEETNFVRNTGRKWDNSGNTVDTLYQSPDKETNISPTDNNSHQNELESIPPYRPKSYWGKLRLWQKAGRQPGRLSISFWRPMVLLTFPVVFFCGFYYGSNLIWFNVLNGTAALVLTGTYRFSTRLVGASYVAPLLGIFLGAAYTGICGDKVMLYMARNNGGVSESEHRLLLMLPAIVVLPCGLILWGVGAAHHIHWLGAIVAMFLVSMASGISVQGMSNYCLESYRELGGEAIVAVILIRNTMSFAMGYGVTPWVTGLGLQNAFIVAAVVSMIPCAAVLLMIRFGKGLRERSRKRYARYMKTVGSD